MLLRLTMRIFLRTAPSDSIWLMAAGIILRANKAELELMGYSADEYVGRPIADFHADADVIADILRRLTAGERLDKYPARLKAKDGSIKHVLISSSVLFRDGEFINTRCFSVDVTASREAEAARLEAERRLAKTYESVTVGIGETDARRPLPEGESGVRGHYRLFPRRADRDELRRDHPSTTTAALTWPFTRTRSPAVGTPIPSTSAIAAKTARSSSSRS